MNSQTKTLRYNRILKQLNGLVFKTDNRISIMSTIVTLLHYKMDYFYWTGFYLLHKHRLLVGPSQGKLACIELKAAKGVCWAAINQAKPIVVPDVHTFSGHIACDPKSKSEIAVPFGKENQIIGVLDIDSLKTGSFDDIDVNHLVEICGLIMKS